MFASRGGHLGPPQAAFSPCLSELSQERARCAGQKAGVRTPHRSPLDPQCHAIQLRSLWPGNQLRQVPHTKVGEGVVGTPHRSPLTQCDGTPYTWETIKQRHGRQ